MKKAIIATLLSGAISLPAFAANGNDLADANLIFNMDNSQSMELAVLSSEEMKSTEGAFWQYGLGGLAGAYGAGYGYLAGGGSSPWGFLGSIPINSWKTMRDTEIVKQDLDYSCGAASLATVLNEYYGLSVTEEEILKIMDKEDMRASFDDMANALKELGFRGVGYAASFEQLTKLKIPVIVYTKHRRDDHFSVLRGINSDTVWLADPSQGNRTYSRYQFLEMWETREDSELKGKILAIIPLDQEVQSVSDFFTSQPRRQTAQAVQQQVFRNTH